MVRQARGAVSGENWGGCGGGRGRVGRRGVFANTSGLSSRTLTLLDQGRFYWARWLGPAIKGLRDTAPRDLSCRLQNLHQGCRERRRLDTLGCFGCRFECSALAVSGSARRQSRHRRDDLSYVLHKDEARGRGENADQCGKEEVKVRRQSRGRHQMRWRDACTWPGHGSVAHTGFGLFW